MAPTPWNTENFMTAAKTPNTKPVPASVWSLRERFAGRLDSWLSGPLDPLLQLFTGGAVLQYQTALRPRLDAWAKDGVFNLVVGRYWLEVEKRGTLEQQAARKAARAAELQAALWGREDLDKDN